MIKIVTDSCADLPLELVQQYDIQVVPVEIYLAGQLYQDGVDINTDKLFALMSTTKEFPQTSQPAPARLQKIYAPLVAVGHSIISIHLTSVLSGTVTSAHLAAQMFPQAEIHVVDSLSVSLGQGLMVLRAAQWATEGYDAATIVHRLATMIRGMRIYFAVDTLEHLHRGGRIGGATRFLGTLLNMKPILEVREGKIEALERQRSSRRALKRLYELAIDAAQPAGDVYVAVAHAQAEDTARQLAADLQTALNPKQMVFGNIGATVAAHGGPGVVGACVYVEK